jgi:aminocarboxymuconate-semialdehyde decarboxylase
VGATFPHNEPTGIVDVHTHAIDPDFSALPGRSGNVPRLSVQRLGDTQARIMLDGMPYRTVDDRCWSPDRRIADMDREGIAIQVLSPIPVTFCYDAQPEPAAKLASEQNDFLARVVAARPDRFAALGAVPLQDPTLAIVELRRLMARPGFIGVEVGAQVAGTELADPSLDEFFTVAAELGTLILVHPVDQDLYARIIGLKMGFGLGMPVETAVAAAALLTSGSMRRRPGVKYCLAHGGGALPSVLGRLDKGAELAGMQPDSADLPSRLARQMLCDSVAYDLSTLQHAAHTFGTGHVVYGSDYPFPAMPGHPDSTLQGLPDGLRADIARNNILAICEHSFAASTH